MNSEKKTQSEAVITWSALSLLLLVPGTDPAASGRSSGAATATPNDCRSTASPTRSPPPRMAIKSCMVRVFQDAHVSKLAYHKYECELDLHRSMTLHLQHIYKSLPHALSIKDLMRQGTVLRVVPTLGKGGHVSLPWAWTTAEVFHKTICHMNTAYLVYTRCTLKTCFTTDAYC